MIKYRCVAEKIAGLTSYETFMNERSQSRLSRLTPEYYCGFAWIHWTMTTAERNTGWLTPTFYYKFRELLTHVAFRGQLACPIFCLMPDHIHLLWCGITEESDQRVAMKHLRQTTNECLKRIGYEFQRQPFDHVLKNEELDDSAIESLVDYLARNPERKQLVPVDKFAQYPFTSCLIPGYPGIRLFEPDSWEVIWRTIAFLKRTQCFRIPDPMRKTPS